jgi:hypothetical protein
MAKISRYADGSPKQAKDLFIVARGGSNRSLEGEDVSVGLDGWVPVSDTWTYASATTITVPSGAASIYSVGDKVKITQTTAKYFYITGVADTTLTVYAGSDYTVANAAITSPCYSKALTPIDFPVYFSYTPTWLSLTKGSGTEVASMAMHGRTVFGAVQFTFAADSSISGTTYVAMPLTPALASRMPIGYCTYLDSGVAQYAGVALIEGGNARLKTFAVAASFATQGDVNTTSPFTWTTNDQILVSFSYEL